MAGDGRWTRRAAVAAGAAALTGTRTHRSVGAQCTLVELRPGYPGYKGYVTGLDGVGDFVCLEDLERANSGFDREAVDRAHRDVARVFGIGGSPDDWIWETWMAIDALRRHNTTCHICAWRDAAGRSSGAASPVRHDDYRLRIGSVDTTSALAAVTGARPGRNWAWLSDVFPYDRSLRAMAALNLGEYPTASELWVQYEVVIDSFLAGGWVDPDAVTAAVLSRNGYVATPAIASYEDQIYMVGTGLELALASLTPWGAGAFTAVFDDLALQWRSQALTTPVPTQSFAEFIRASGALPLAK